MNIGLGLGVLAGIFEAVGLIPYLRDVIAGKTRPSRASWSVWLVLSISALGGQYAAGARASLLFTGVQTLACLVIWLFAMKRGRDAFSPFDVVCLILATVSFILWLGFRTANYSLQLVVLTDFLGLLPTLKKSYLDPRSETLSAWVLSALGGFTAALAVGDLDFLKLEYPLYIGLANVLICGLLLWGRAYNRQIIIDKT